MENAPMAQALRTLGRGIIVAGLGLLVACGDSGDGGTGTATGNGKPDTGYGKSQPVPATQNCVSLCQRLSDCAGNLCDEDTSSTMYLPLIPLLAGACQSSCNEAQILSGFTSDQWQCLFQNSCRAVLGANVCHTPNTSYTCNN
jgi:hypothetical protein